MRVRCANCDMIWELVAYVAWYVAPHHPQIQTTCPGCGSNAYNATHNPDDPYPPRVKTGMEWPGKPKIDPEDDPTDLGTRAKVLVEDIMAETPDQHYRGHMGNMILAVLRKVEEQGEQRVVENPSDFDLRRTN